MRAIVMDRFGGSEVLHSAELPVPKPADDEILVQVMYAAVNPVDWKIREGYFKDQLPYQFPIILGWDVSGVVTSVGQRVTRFKLNDRIYAYCKKPVLQWGAYAEFLTLPETQAARMPHNIGFRDAAVIPVAALSAWQALFDHAKLKANETVLIHAGAGGVGLFAIQMARNVGAGVLTTASLRNHDLVRSYGAMQAIDYARDDFSAVAHKASAGGVDVVLDLMGGETLKKSFAALKPGGRLISLVETPDPALAQKMKVHAANFRITPGSELLTDLALQFDDGRLKAPPIREYDLKEAGAAQSLSQTGHVQGKIVLKVK